MGSSPAYTYGEGDIIAGKYGVVEHLGRGGFGEVYLVEIITGMVGEQLALKLLPESVGADDSKRDRFLNEIRLAMKLVDRNIVTTRDVGNCQKGQPYFTMDYCPGRTLAEVVESEAPLELPRAVSLVQTILDGLQAAHDQPTYSPPDLPHRMARRLRKANPAGMPRDSRPMVQPGED